MRKIIFLAFTFLLATLFSCSSSDDNSNNETNYIEWYINGTKYTNGNISKTIGNDEIEILESNQGLYLYFLSDNGTITTNTTYNSTNANVDITMDNIFDTNSQYNLIVYNGSENIKITENNSDYISGEFDASVSTLMDSDTGNTSTANYPIINGKFKIYK